MNEEEIIEEAIQLLPKGDYPANFYEDLKQAIRERSSRKIVRLLQQERIFQQSFAFLHLLRDKRIFNNQPRNYDTIRVTMLGDYPTNPREFLDDFARYLREHNIGKPITREQDPTSRYLPLIRLQSKTWSQFYQIEFCIVEKCNIQ